MKISIGENIKRLRKQKDITQEKLAEALNVSVVAVSKWERNESYPDITLLFPLAHYFKISVDELMGYNTEKIEQDILNTLKEYTSISKSYSNHHLAKDFIAKAYKKYPNDFRIMSEYAWCIAGGFADNDNQCLLDNYEELWKICEKLIYECNDSSIVLNAKGLKAKLLHAKGNTNEAIELLESNFSNSWDTASHRIEQLFQKDSPEYRYWNRVNVYEYAQNSALKLGRAYWYSDGITDEEKVVLCEKAIDALSCARKETNEAYFALMEYDLTGSFNFRLLASRPDMVVDIARLLDKTLSAAKALTELIKSDEALKKIFSGKVNYNPLKWEIMQWKTIDHPQISKLRNEPKIVEIINKYDY